MDVMENYMIPHNLSIFSFNKKNGKVIFLTMTVILFFLLGNKALNYLYWEDNEWCRIFWHNFYKQAENIDYVYLGSSHVYCDINPEILDEKNGRNNFNMALPAQRLIESYYLLTEADRYNDIKEVYLELYYNPSTGISGNYQEKLSVQNGWRAIDSMKLSFSKAKAIVGMNPIKYYPEACFPFIRYREHLTDGNWIKDRVNYKENDNYKKYIYNDGTTEFRDKGHYYTTRELTNLIFTRDRKPEEMYLTEDAEEYLRKIIEYCQRKNIPITLFSSPIYAIQPIATGNYDQYANRIKEIASEYTVPYYDFNMAKEEYLSIQHPEYFMDVGHLNAKGAEIFTNFFYQVVSEKQDDTIKYFYESYQEKLGNSKSRVYGIYCYNAEESELQGSDELGKTRRMVIASNRENELEYQIFLTPDGGETVLLQDFATNKHFNISAEEHGSCKIVWRNINDEEKIGNMDIQY